MPNLLIILELLLTVSGAQVPPGGRKTAPTASAPVESGCEGVLGRTHYFILECFCFSTENRLNRGKSNDEYEEVKAKELQGPLGIRRQEIRKSIELWWYIDLGSNAISATDGVYD
jgi:hypothetical protein